MLCQNGGKQSRMESHGRQRPSDDKKDGGVQIPKAIEVMMSIETEVQLTITMYYRIIKQSIYTLFYHLRLRMTRLMVVQTTIAT